MHKKKNSLTNYARELYFITEYFMLYRVFDDIKESFFDFSR
jgi:hypothetical protein